MPGTARALPKIGRLASGPVLATIGFMTDDAPKPVGAAKPSGGAERRRTQRAPVEMWVEELTGDSQVFRRAGNLSRGGIYLDKTIPIPVGTTVRLRFTLPGDTRPLEVDGVIVSIDPTLELGMGVKFQELSDADAERIDRWVYRALTPVEVIPTGNK